MGSNKGEQWFYLVRIELEFVCMHPCIHSSVYLFFVCLCTDVALPHMHTHMHIRDKHIHNYNEKHFNSA